MSLRATPLQKLVLIALETPGVYLSHELRNNWQVSGAPKRVLGVSIEWIIPDRTVKCLSRAGLIEWDKRRRYSRQQVGYFLVKKSEEKS